MRDHYFKVCENCGAHLDPCEACDCDADYDNSRINETPSNTIPLYNYESIYDLAYENERTQNAK